MTGIGESRKEGGWAPFTARQRLFCMSSRDLVECRIGNIRGSDRRCSINDGLQRLHDLGVTGAAVSLCVGLRLPEAVTNGFRKIGRDKGNFIHESLLLTQHGNYFLLNQAGKFRGGFRFELNYYMTGKHTAAPLVLSY